MARVVTLRDFNRVLIPPLCDASLVASGFSAHFRFVAHAYAAFCASVRTLTLADIVPLDDKDRVSDLNEPLGPGLYAKQHPNCASPPRCTLESGYSADSKTGLGRTHRKIIRKIK